MRAALRLASLCLCATGCQFDPYGSEYTESRPERAALVGAYRPDERSTREFRERYGLELSSTELRLDAAGSFTARALPDCWREALCSRRLQSVHGTWSPEHHRDWWSLRLLSESVDGKKDEFGGEAMLRGEKPPYLVHFIIGDPDSGEGLVFEKVDTAAAAR